MKIVISGGTGFIGRPLADRLASAGHEVTVLSRQERATWNQKLQVRLSTPSTPIPQDVLSGMEAFLHLAAEPLAGRWTRARMARIKESRAGGTQRLMLRAAEAPRLRVILNASGVGFYGPRPHGEVTEADAPGAGFLAEVTAAREQMAELARAPHRRILHLRIGLVLHPAGGYLAQLEQLARRGFSGQMGAGDQGISWLHRTDLLRLVEHSLQHGSLDGPLNACAPGRTTNRELAQAVAAATGRRGVRMPGWLAKLMLGELGSTLLQGQHVQPHRACQSGFEFHHPDLPGALTHLFGEARRGAEPGLKAPLTGEVPSGVGS